MSKQIDSSRALQIGILALLIVSGAQVVWWFLDQGIKTGEVRQRWSEHYQTDLEAAAQLAERGAGKAEIEQLFPHVEIAADGVPLLRDDAVQAMDRERRRWLVQYGWEGGFFLVVLIASMAVVWRAVHQHTLLRKRQQNFIAAVSHELKSPLASLQLSAETIGLRELPQERVRTLVERMLEDLGRMEDMVSKILDAARLESGHVHLHPERVQVAGAVRETLKELATEIEQGKVDVEVDVANGLAIQADPLAVRTVLRNLIDNGLKAMAPNNRGHLSIQGAEHSRGVSLKITDDGIGFEPQEAGKLFKKFYRPGDELRRRSPGQGLGLFIVQRFVQFDGGWVRGASPGNGKGAVFTVSWPAARGESQ